MSDKPYWPNFRTDDDFEIYKGLVGSHCSDSEIVALLWIIIRFLYYISWRLVQMEKDK